MPCPRWKKWEPWEVALLHGDKPTAEIAKITGRKLTVVTSARTRAKKPLRKGRWRGPNRPGNSMYDKHYAGPSSWTVEQGPPCRVCEYNECKFADKEKWAFRWECRTCSARLAWDKHNGGLRQKPGYFELIVETYETETIGVDW